MAEMENGARPASGPVDWPEGRRFAFTVFDDPDGQPLEKGREVYAFLRDLGFRTTKGVWPLGRSRPVSDSGGDASDPAYRDWLLQLQEEGFELGFHAATSHTSPREATARALEVFHEEFGHDPLTMSNHYDAEEGIYFGEARLTGVNRLFYNLLTRGANRGRYRGHVESDPLFWGDLCREHITYCRNFVFDQVDTLGACPLMPYHDPARPYVKAWYASTEGANCGAFVKGIAEERQDALEESGGLCIMYTHFGHRFVSDDKLDPRFVALMERLASKGGWYVPVGTVLEYLRERRGIHTLTARERGALERRWLLHKARVGTA